MTAVHLTQCLIYQRGKDNRTLRKWCWCFLSAEITLMAFFFSLECLLSAYRHPMPYLLQSQMLFGYALVITNTSKYLGQCYFHHIRKSTVGFSMVLVFLDLTGSVFSLLQLALMETTTTTTALVSFNVVKCLLGAIGVVFDIAFLV